MKTCTETVTVEVHVDPASIVSDWADLADRVGTVFSSRPGFVLNVAKATKLDCLYVGVRRDGRLVALAALSLVKRGPMTLAKVIGTNLGVPLEFLSEDAASSDALLGALARQGFMVGADSMIVDDPTTVELIGHPRWHVDAVVRERVPYIDLPAGSTASSIRSAKSLKRLRQYRSEVRRTSSYEVEKVADVAHLDARWDDIVDLAARAVEGTDKVNYLVSPHGEFARDFLRSEARAGRLCIAGLVIDGRWAAHEIGVRTKGRMEGWLTHYDASVGKCQPGHQLIEWFADNHDQLGVTVLDQGVEVNHIKSVWAKSGYDVLRVSAVPAEWRGARLLAQALRRYSPTVTAVRDCALSLLGHLDLRRR